jgi:hypothetical protein
MFARRKWGKTIVDGLGTLWIIYEPGAGRPPCSTSINASTIDRISSPIVWEVGNRAPTRTHGGEWVEERMCSGNLIQPNEPHNSILVARSGHAWSREPGRCGVAAAGTHKSMYNSETAATCTHINIFFMVCIYWKKRGLSSHWPMGGDRSPSRAKLCDSLLVVDGGEDLMHRALTTSFLEKEKMGVSSWGVYGRRHNRAEVADVILCHTIVCMICGLHWISQAKLWSRDDKLK